ncbi:hypothetical protein PE066_13735 [Ramlibacter tataouinensis]|uniref:hypothetical protein n=1 Tax=Ramlibacter tataouinensis TaxID=94132 RepID=UPI0022F3EBFD|nr:hypothetical protein [Ramlibacter tataouinensis]WBY00526.1 hypothetical protein PE066_13735 [Ramlibacter tataouinensis]
MAHLISEQRIVPTWVAAIRLLHKQGPQLRNIVLEMESPTLITDEDRTVLDSVDSAVRTHADVSVKTVAATIFPQALYRRYGRPGVYKELLDALDKGKAKGTWGTYAQRMMQRKGREQKTVNPLDQIVTKLERAATTGKPYQAVYEMGVYEPAEDLDEGSEPFCELPLYNVARDGAMVSNMPCLSHLSFKKSGSNVDLTAVYRSHYYCERALGNLVGLSQLLNFVAKESKHAVGTLTCVSTHAVLDIKAWGNQRGLQCVLETFPA